MEMTLSMTRRLASALVAAFLTAAAGCDQGNVSAAPAKSDSASAALTAASSKPTPNGGVIDSALPLDEELRRFRANLPRVTALEHAAPSREALVQQFIRALERNDTTALVRLHVTRAEYAWLIYPSSANSHPPYHQPPDIAWMLSKASTEKGLTRLMARRAGKPLGVVGHTCNEEPEREGENRIWRGCELRVRSGTGIETARQRLFGSIIERDGRFKFLSYSNQF